MRSAITNGDESRGRRMQFLDKFTKKHLLNTAIHGKAKHVVWFRLFSFYSEENNSRKTSLHKFAQNFHINEFIFL